jgi:hypothetical protein
MQHAHHFLSLQAMSGRKADIADNAMDWFAVQMG